MVIIARFGFSKALLSTTQPPHQNLGRIICFGISDCQHVDSLAAVCDVARRAKINATLIHFRHGYSVTGRAPLQSTQ
jgi:hypothetical protein